MKDIKKTKNVRELLERFQTNCDRINEMADLCEQEKRERTEAETVEYETIVRENQMLQMKMNGAAAEHLRENPNAREDAIKIIRENASKGRKTEITFVRDLMMVSDVQSGAIVPLNVQDIMKPLTEGFILDKVGLPMPTGLSGDYVWPMYEMVEAQIAGEGVALSDTKIPFSKMTAAPERIGIAIPVTNQSLNQSQGVLETVVREIMPLSIRLLLNRILFSTDKVNGATNLEGPFVDLVHTATSLDAVPSFRQLNGMKASVLSTGVDGEHLCWIMSKSMEAILEGAPINKDGIFVPIVQNHTLCGLPIYTSNVISKRVVTYQKYTAGSTNAWAAYTMTSGDKPTYDVTGVSEEEALKGITEPAGGKIAKITVVTEYIGLGDWRYQPMGMFGTMRFIVDPYSQARKDSVDFVLNTDYATKTLRKEAFRLGKVSAEE